MTLSQLYCVKYQILGNSYIVVPTDQNEALSDWMTAAPDLTVEPGLRPDLVRQLCSLETGIGGEGVILGPINRPGQPTALHIYNVDGTRCNFSGNAIRMMARYMVDSGALSVQVGESIDLTVTGFDAAGEPTENTAQLTFDANDGSHIAARLAAPKIGPGHVPYGLSSVMTDDGRGLWLRVPQIEALGGPAQYWTTCSLVDVGNPHCIFYVDDYDHLPSVDFSEMDTGKLTAIAYAGTSDRHPDLGQIFPEGCNLQFAWIDPIRKRLVLRTFERGRGPCGASGSSSASAAAAGYARGLIGPEVLVEMPGGSMTIRLDGPSDGINAISLASPVIRIGQIWCDPFVMETRSAA